MRNKTKSGKNYKVILFGAQNVSIKIVDFLLHRSDVDLCVVSSDLERDLLFSSILLKDFCLKMGCQVMEEPDLEKISNFFPDLILSIYYRKILSNNILKTPRLGAINLHPSLLPKYRGCVPTYWAILNGEKYTGITLHYMKPEIDNGDIIAQSKIKINNKSGPELHISAMKRGFELFKSSFDDIILENNKRVAQNHSIATYFGPYRPQFRYLNWNNRAEDILRHIKAHKVPFQGSVAWNHDGEIRIDKAKILKIKGLPAGKFKIVDKKIFIQTQDYQIVSDQWCNIYGYIERCGFFISGAK